MTRTIIWICVTLGMVLAHWFPKDWGVAPTWKQIVEFSFMQAMVLAMHWFWNRPHGYHPK